MIDSFDISGLDKPKETFAKLFTVDKEQGVEEVNGMREYYKIFEGTLPAELSAEADKTKEIYKNS